MLKNMLLCGLLLGCIGSLFAQKKYTLASPDKTIQVSLTIGDSITYAVLLDGREVVTPSMISFKTSADKAAIWKVSKTATSSKDEILKPIVPQKSTEVRDHCNQLRIDFSNGLSLEWRAYDNGIAWHWISNHKGQYTVQQEQAIFGMQPTGRAWYPQEEGFFSHNERQYRNYRIDSIDEKRLASLPALFESQGAKLLITESALINYAGCWLRGRGNGQLQAVFPHYPREKKVTSDRDEKVTAREDFIARIEGAQSFPWRIIMVARNDKDLLTNQLPYQLGRPAVGDFSWVRPGKVQWDWWHYNNIYGVPFRAGINNDTYKYYIDFAAKYGIEYVLLDEGWCDTRDLMKQSPGIDVEELANYARVKKVDLLLWTSWLVLDRQLDTALKTFAQWGIKGIKVDFMQRDDQDMVRYYQRVAEAAAGLKMLVDFHGAYKPTGWLRTWPNVMTSEGVLGNEISKFAGSIDPEHTTTIPFTRMAAGPMDFTPGGMLNAQKNAWAAVPGEPLTLGTRCNQLAMYVMYESPLQMLCDMPTHYYREPEAMEFLKAVPAVWAQTIPLEAKVGDYVAMARQALNGDWFLGAMTDWSPRELSLDLSFLPEGQYRMMVWKDGPNADRNAKDFAQETLTVDRNKKVNIKLAKGGGYVARLIKQ